MLWLTIHFFHGSRAYFIQFSSHLLETDNLLFQSLHDFFLQSGYVGLRDAEKIGHFFLSHFFAVLICQAVTQFYNFAFSGL